MGLLDWLVTLFLRSYRESVREGCLTLFRSNIPHFFAPSEGAAFAEFLDTLPPEPDTPYFVIRDDVQVVGCGGFFISGERAGLCWGMVDSARHRRGIGILLLERLKDLYERYPTVRAVLLDTTQHSKDFFARFGFEVLEVTPSSYAPGLDRYEMRLLRAELARLFKQPKL